ncbi:MAG: hypothetical protein AB1805_16350 [Nitrospirota bacterium]
MNDERYTRLICKKFCSFYKGTTEELRCETYNFLAEHLTPAELNTLLTLARLVERESAPDFSKDAEVNTLVCERCEFRIDGCDFRENGSAPPCGGYVIIEKLLS